MTEGDEAVTLTFQARIEGGEARCLIGSDALVPAPVWCFSTLAPARVASGGTTIRSLAGYAEVQLPDLRPGEPREVVLALPGGVSANRAALPQGGYLRLEDDATLALPSLPSGVAEAPARPSPPVEGLPLVPPPASWEPAGGALEARGLACPPDDALAAVARLAERLGLGPFDNADGAPVRLRHDLTLPAEGYRLEVAADGVTLRAGDRAGRLHAGVTLLNLLALTGGRLPLGRIEDAPRFAWRGLHLDCARHFFSPATLGRVLDLMALLKLNRFHWHLADDEAFRLELEAAPDLAARTAWRGEGCLIPGVGGGGVRAGGSYGRTDVAALLARGEELGIGVMPGIELPAHAFALCAAMPALRDPEDRGGEAGAYPRALANPAMAATWDLLLPLVDEVGGMFPLGVLHLGGRGLPAGAWEGSPAVDGLKAARGLAGAEEVRGWMMARLAARLGEKGVRAAVWEEAGARLGAGALVFARGDAPAAPGAGAAGAAGAAGGPEVVLAPPALRLDRAHTDDPGDWGTAGALPLEDVVDWRVAPIEEAGSRVAGLEGTFWSEAVTDDAQLEPLVAPRVLGLAAKAWSPRGRVDGDGLRALAGAYGPVFDRIGWRRNQGA